MISIYLSVRVEWILTYYESFVAFLEKLCTRQNFNQPLVQKMFSFVFGHVRITT